MVPPLCDEINLARIPSPPSSLTHCGEKLWGSRGDPTSSCPLTPRPETHQCGRKERENTFSFCLLTCLLFVTCAQVEYGFKCKIKPFCYVLGIHWKYFFKRKEFRKVLVWVVAHCRLVENMEMTSIFFYLKWNHLNWNHRITKTQLHVYQLLEAD